MHCLQNRYLQFGGQKRKTKKIRFTISLFVLTLEKLEEQPMT